MRMPPPHFGTSLPGQGARGTGPRTKKAKRKIVMRAEKEAARERDRLRPVRAEREEEDDD